MREPCALYRLWDKSGGLLYVGCSTQPLSRMKSHEGIKPWATAVSAATLEWFPDKTAALVAEKEAIASELPEWNVHHRPNPKHSGGRLRRGFSHADPATWAYPMGAAK